jgi:hypothetical protein
MAKDDRDILEVLEGELGFIEKGGYGRSVRTPWLRKSTFQDSLSCRNYGYLYRAHPCTECHLIDFVPPEKRSETVPCHFIPLDDAGDTIEELETEGIDYRMLHLVRQWLRTQINRIGTERQETSDRMSAD